MGVYADGTKERGAGGHGPKGRQAVAEARGGGDEGRWQVGLEAKR